MNDDNNNNNEQKYLIFLAGPTGAGKSKVKETVLEYLGIKTDPNNYNEYIGVDDFFETNDTAKHVFKTIYDNYTTNGRTFENIGDYKINSQTYRYYLNSIKSSQYYTFLQNCILPNLSGHFNNKKEIPFSHFTTDVYFALRKLMLDSEFENHIEANLKKPVIFLETNASSVTDLKSWYTKPLTQFKRKSKTYCKPYLSKSFVDYFNDRTIVYVFIQCKLDSTINNMRTRFLKEIAAFMNNSHENPVPRLPEMDTETVQKKFENIQNTLNKLISDHSNHRVLIYNNKHCDDARYETYNLVYDTTENGIRTIDHKETYNPTKQNAGNRLRKTRRKRRSVKSSRHRHRHRRYQYRSRRRSRSRKS
jgi:hypothetical protein